MQRSSPTFRSVLYFTCEIFEEYDSPEFIELCIETPCWMGTKHGGRNQQIHPSLSYAAKA